MRPRSQPGTARGADRRPGRRRPLPRADRRAARRTCATFARSLGGTATNVAVGAARLGHRSAVLTKVGPDAFGDYVREALAGFGVDPPYVGTAEGLLTPVVFCALDPPEDPPLLFYRLPVAPDLTLDHGRRPVGPGRATSRCSG